MPAADSTVRLKSGAITQKGWPHHDRAEIFALPGQKILQFERIYLAKPAFF